MSYSEPSISYSNKKFQKRIEIQMIKNISDKLANLSSNFE